MSSPQAVLMDMGFSKEKVDRALEVTGNLGVEPAMEWLLAHGDQFEGGSSGSTASIAQVKVEPTGDEPIVVDTDNSQQQTNNVPEPQSEAKSLQCNDCGKLFKTQGEVEFHAAKTGHANFSESVEEKKPLTEEEKQEQKKLIEQKLLEKKKEREEKEKAESVERERNRIRSGKEMVNIKKKMEDDELRKAIEDRKREKEEDKKARQKIIDQIEADKLARKAKQNRLMNNVEESVAPAAPVPLAEPSKPLVKKDYTETRLQIRLLNGESLTQTFGLKEQLSAVRLYISINRTDGSGPFSLMTNFPRRVFTDEDYDKPLEVLGLFPSAVIIVTKALPL